MAKVIEIQHSIADKIVVLCEILRSLMENMEARNEISKDIVEMLEKRWLIGERRRITFY